jgi:hypothetical protein
MNKKIEIVEDFVIEKDLVDSLRKEYKSKIEHLLTDSITNNQIIVAKTFRLRKNNKDNLNMDEVPFVRSLSEKVSKIFDFTDIVYRATIPNTAYDWHKDYEKLCYHLPLYTNSGCHFIFHNECYHMEIGKLYRVENDAEHTFVNSGRTLRVHLVFNKMIVPTADERRRTTSQMWRNDFKKSNMYW